MTATTLTGHTSFETAHETADYPYGYSQRTQRREWVEYRPKYGYRYVTATRNPKTGKWNKPKASTYYELMVLVLDGEGHVKYDCLSYHATNDAIDRFESKYGDTFDDHMRDTIKWLRAVRVAESKVTWTIMAGPTYAMNASDGQMRQISEGDERPRQTLQEQAQIMHNLTAAAYRGDIS